MTYNIDREAALMKAEIAGMAHKAKYTVAKALDALDHKVEQMRVATAKARRAASADDLLAYANGDRDPDLVARVEATYERLGIK